jgi:hypothetical protein
VTLSLPFPAATPNRVVLSEDGLYRYSLIRELGPGRRLCVCLVNPSVACATKDDHTWLKGIGFGRRLGFGSLEYVNLFAWIDGDVTAISRVTDPVGPENDRHIATAVKRCDLFLVAWGTHGTLHNRDRQVLAMVRELGVKPYCLRVNKDGTPEHLARLPWSLKPQPYLGRPETT